MENAPTDIDVFETLDEPALAEDGALVGDVPAIAPAPANPAERSRREAPSLEERTQMHTSFNDRISYLCKLAALVIAVVALATIALGQELPQFVLMGLCLAVALLAIAMLQDHSQRKQ